MICPSCKAENDETAQICFTCGKPMSAGITRGTVISSRYEILSPLGRGGMGMVYKAHDRVLDETVALKVLRSDIAQDPDMARRFRTEIRLARKVRHKNVCGIHEYGEDGPVHYIAMEFIEGIDLKKVLRQTRVGLHTDEAFEVAVQVASGLQAIHDAGIIHRDLKTPNIMRDAKGLIRLMDFGIAKEEGALSGQTATGLIVGTPEYMSPEQARGEKVDSRTDIYALGIVIFEVFTGNVPFHGDTPLATILKQLKDPPPVELMDEQHMPTELREVLLSCLAKEPKDRFSSAEQVAEALRRARQQHFPERHRPAPISTATAPQPEPVEEASVATTAIPTPVPTGVPTARTPIPPDLARPTTSRPARPAPRPTGTLPRAQLVRRNPTWVLFIPVALIAVGAGGYLALRSQATTPTPPDPTPRPTAPSPGLASIGATASVTAGQALTTPSPHVVATVVPATVAPPPTAAPVRDSPHPLIVPTPTPRPAVVSTTPPPLPTLPLARATPSPVTTPAPTPRAERPTPRPAAVETPAVSVEAKGDLQLVVTPWAEVAIDGNSLGTTPLRKLTLSAGPHSIVLTHPDYQPLRRKVTIAAGGTSRLVVDLTQDAVPKRR